jgi:hypothetical protein
MTTGASEAETGTEHGRSWFGPGVAGIGAASLLADVGPSPACPAGRP